VTEVLVMRLLRPAAIIAALLIIAVSIPQSLFSQQATKQSQPKPPAPRQRQPRRPQRADALAPEIKKLLEVAPLAPESPDKKASKRKASEDDDKPPADDAPIKELVAYWANRQRAGANASKPSDKVRQRLLEACEDSPADLYFLLDLLPQNADTHDRLYKLLNEENQGEELWRKFARTWLRRNSAYFRDELIREARAADDDVYWANEDLRALARLDWNAARPILEILASAGKAFATPLALALLYEHAIQEGESARAEGYRALMKAIVENRHADRMALLLVLPSLMNSEWSGQEEWFVSLFADPALSNFQEDKIKDAAESKNESSASRDTPQDAVAANNVMAVRYEGHDWEAQMGIFAYLLHMNTFFHVNADRWLPIVSNLVGHNHRTVHKAAVRCLLGFLGNKYNDEKKKKEIAQKLIPCLTEPNWTTKEDRSEFIRRLTGLKMPELTPGLIWILDYDEDPFNRLAAAEALTKYRDQRANPALRRALEKEENEYRRKTIVTALAECGGFSDDEMAEAVEAYARVVVTEKGKKEILEIKYGESDISLPLKVSIGRILDDSETIQANEGLAVGLIERAKALRATEPTVAREILRVIEDSPLLAVEFNLVERIGEGWADVDSIARALEKRDALGMSAGAELYGMVKQGGYVAGVAMAIHNDEREWKAALEGRDAKAQLALLACSRYLRDKLPIKLVSRLLDSQNRALAKAAESYLEVEDSAEARKLILARHPGEAYILGEIRGIYATRTVRSWEDPLRKEIRGGNGLEAIYAVGRQGMASNFTGVIIRIRGGKAEISVHETEGRRNIRWLTNAEFEELMSFTSRQEIEDLGPQSYFQDGIILLNYEYLRLTREGGRRIMLDDLGPGPKNSTLHEELSGLFYRLCISGEFTARYNIEDKIPGVEVVFADKTQSVLRVCAEDGEIRTLIEGKSAENRLGATKDEPEWREFSSGKPGDVRGEPSACRILNATSSAMKTATVISPNPFGQPAQSDGLMFYAASGEDDGIWKAEPGMEPVKIVSGNYYRPVITPDGKWLVAIKLVIEKGMTINQWIRRNLRSGQEFVVTSLRNSPNHRAEYVAAHGKVLVLNDGYAKAAPENESFLLDPETGTIQPVKGEFRPLIDSVSRAPQSAGAPNLFWAAIYDWGKKETKFGRYDTKNFVFTHLLEIPELRLRSDDIWVDSDVGKIWFVYQGHLLRLPLPAQKK
jgi:HEAT repeat protein